MNTVRIVNGPTYGPGSSHLKELESGAGNERKRWRTAVLSGHDSIGYRPRSRKPATYTGRDH